MSRDLSIRNAPITVIIPTYNSASTIERALKSIIVQSLLPREIIIIDDSSLDNTLEVINAFVKQYSNFLDIRILSTEKNSGAGHSRNIGLTNAKFNMIAFLDSDDTWHPDKLNLQYRFMIANPNCCLSGHLLVLNDLYKNNITKQKFNKISFNKISFNKLLFKNYFNTPTVMMRYNKVNFPNNQRYSEDYHLWLHTTKYFNNSYFLNLELASVHKPLYGISGLSNDLTRMYTGEVISLYSLFNNSTCTAKFFISISILFSSLKFFLRVLYIYIIKILK